ncbi:MAG: type IV secretory system conjugative DNA transfer family protein [Pseudomonadota bacterium]
MNFDPRDHPYGTAEFSSDAQIRRAFRARGGLPIAFHRGKLLTHSARSGMLLVSGAGAQKWVSVLAHSALTRGRNGEPPRFLFFDPKGEMAAVMAWGLIHSGAHVYCINPWHLHGLPNQTLSLLSHLKEDSPTLVADARNLARTLQPESADESSKFFDITGQNWFDPLIRGPVYADGSVSFSSLYALLGLIHANPDGWIDRAAEMAACGPSDLEVAYKQMIEMAAESRRTFDSVLAGMSNALSFLTDPNVRGSLVDDDEADTTLDVMTEDSDRPIFFFICIPPELVPQNAPLIRAIFSVMRTLKQRKPQSPTVNLVIDEAATLGRFPEIAEFFSVGRGFGLCPLAVYQSWGQVRSNLGPTGPQILSASADVEVYLGGGVSDLETAQTLSQRLGNQTLALDDRLTQMRAARAKREALHGMLFEGGDPVKAGMTLRALDEELAHTRKIARPLMSPDEILNMPQDKALVIASGYGIRPFLADKRPYYTMRRYAGRMFPNPYFDRAMDRVKVKTLLGMRTRAVIEEPVPERYADFPQYKDGRWRFIQGYRPKT